MLLLMSVVIIEIGIMQEEIPKKNNLFVGITELKYIKINPKEVYKPPLAI